MILSKNKSESKKVLSLRGAITKKITGKFGKNSQREGGVKKIRRKFPISIWELDKPRGGVSIFQKCLNFNYFAIILQYYL